jgi:hypothetical protein
MIGAFRGLRAVNNPDFLVEAIKPLGERSIVWINLA